MKLKPVLTEKSIESAKSGRYTFWVPLGLTKPQIGLAIKKAFGFEVESVKTVRFKPGSKKNLSGRKVGIRARKKAVVSLIDKKQKIDIFGKEQK